MIKAIKFLKEKLSKRLNVKEEDILFSLLDSHAGIHMTAEEFYHQYNPEEIQKGHCKITGKLEVSGEAIAMFMIRDLAGCGGILVFNDLFVMPGFRNKTIGTTIFDFVREFGTHYGYGLIQATDTESNKEGNKLFIKCLWNKLDTFKNPKTQNNIVLWGMKL